MRLLLSTHKTDARRGTWAGNGVVRQPQGGS